MTSPQTEISRQEAATAKVLLSGLTELCLRASHDLLGPLNQASALLALFIGRYSNRLDPEADKLLQFLQSTSAAMDGAVGGVRRYLEIASSPARRGPVDLNASLAGSLERLRKAITESGAVIALESLPVVLADADQMTAVFEILIGNSIKFRRPEASPRIRVSWNGMSEIVIADNGIGIDLVHCENVFLPFKRLNGRKYTGAGLGLATAKLIAEMHGCQIRIGPSPDCERSPHGTHVRFTVRTIEAV